MSTCLISPASTARPLHADAIGGSFRPSVPTHVAALLAAMHLGDPRPQALNALSTQEWWRLLAFAEMAHLTLRIPGLPGVVLPPWVEERLARNCEDNAHRFDAIGRTWQETAGVLKTAGVEYALLKGFTRVPDYVREASGRMQSDLDIYCPPASISTALAAFSAIGYQPKGNQDYSRADHIPTLFRQGDWEWQGNLFDPTMPLSIELHHCLWNEEVSGIALPEVNEFWDRRVERTLEGLRFTALSSHDQFAHTSLHILREVLAGDWVLHHVHELAMFLHGSAHHEHFWKAWRRVHSARLRSMTAIAASLSASWFGCTLPAAVQDEMERLPKAVRVWCRQFRATPLEAMFNQNRHALWLHMSLLESPRQRLLLARRALLPGRASALNGQAVTLNNRQQHNVNIEQPYLRYALYVGNRLRFFARSTPATLARGLKWGLAVLLSRNTAASTPHSVVSMDRSGAA